MSDALRELLAPYQAGRLSLRNRVVMPAHTTNFAVDGQFSERHFAYHRERAAGGVGLIITEGMRVHPTSLARTNTVSAFDDRIVPSLNRLTELVHAAGAKIAAQLLHVGRQAGRHNALTPAWGASGIPWSATAPVPHVMTTREIEEVVRGFADAARRVERAGVDAVEVHLGHGHLLQQFLSPVSNRRQDAYGGDPARRLRFAREVLAAVTGAVSSRMPLMLRISADEFTSGGMGVTEMIETMSELLREFRVDVLNVSHSAYLASGSVATQMADMSFEPRPFRALPRAFREAFPEVAVVGVCRLDTLIDAAELIRAGDADLVALARPHIATPDLVARARRRLDGETVPRQDCIACNQACVGRLELGLPISCVVNPETGLEREWRALSDAAKRAAVDDGRPRSLLVVGGGPAGLNAAIAGACAGLDVTLRESSAELGGALRQAMALPQRGRFRVMVEQLVERVLLAGVRVELSRPVGRADLLEAWDGVVVATGAAETRDGWDETLRTVSVASLVADPASGGRHVVVVDEQGGWETLSLVEALIEAGVSVTVVCSAAALFWQVPVYSLPAHLGRLYGRGFRVRLLTEVLVREQTRLLCRDVVSGDPTIVEDITAVTMVRPREPRTELLTALAGASASFEVVGDANAPRTAFEAAFEGRRAGMTVARPATRELRSARRSVEGLL